MKDETTQNIREENSVVPISALGWMRWFWRQLTTMRVALQLLFLLAVASIPGSVFPQRTQSAMKVNQYFAQNPEVSQWLDRLGMFDVYGSFWFSAIYLLLMVSLVGCILPRMKIHAKAIVAPPPNAPRYLKKFEFSQSLVSNEAVESTFSKVSGIKTYLKQKHWRVIEGENFIAAEKGYLRETGNLIFHLAVVLILLAVAFGSTYGYRGQVILREGSSFSNVLAQYDSFTPGRLFKTENLVPFNVSLEKMEVTFEQTGENSAKATDFAATLKFRETANDDFQEKTIGVNSPLDIGNSSMFLLGWGYAPHLIVRDANSEIVFDDVVVFLPQDANFTSTGVIKIPDMQPQLGIQGIFAPTAIVTSDLGPHSMYPDLVNPMIFASFWQGDLGLDSGVPQNIYTLDKTKLEQVGLHDLKPGETWQLKDGSGSVEFVSVKKFATFNIASDPGQNWALFGAILAILGIIASLYIQRRRLWIRVVNDEGQTEVVVAAISRYEDVDLSEVVQEITSECENLVNVAK